MSYLRSFRSSVSFLSIVIVLGIFSLAGPPAALHAQGTSGTIGGTVKDPSGAAIPGADVSIANPVSGYQREVKTDLAGEFRFSNLPFNPYHLTVIVSGFASFTQDVNVDSSVGVALQISLKLGASSANVTVTEDAADLLEVTPTEHTDVDRSLIEQLPIESASSSVSSLVTLASPGIAADSNGLFHGLGDHAENSFSVDGQPITDQQSKVFSNQIPLDSIQSLEVIDGAPPPEFGGKTSVVIKVTTRSGLDQKQPTGEITTSYGSFGSETLGGNVGFGNGKWGEYLSVSGLNTNRFLDPPEFVVMHDNGNETNIFNRLDYKFSNSDSFQLNFNYTRSGFQTPNSYDAQYATAWNGIQVPSNPYANGIGPNGLPVGPQNQTSLINTFSGAPSWTHVLSPNTVLNVGGWVRRDGYTYNPSSDPFSDFTPDLQSISIGQYRTLTNVGARSDLSYVKGVQNIKVGISYEQTFLTENDALGIVDPTVIPGLQSSGACTGATPNPCSTLAPYDLTTGGTYYQYHGHTDIKEFAIYAQDMVTKGPWAVNFGFRGDIYNGLSSASQAEPRGGVAYNIKKSNTVLRISYARTLESPFNENLVITSSGCTNPVVSALMLYAQGFPCTAAPLTPGIRNEFHAGFQQAFGKFFVLSGEYIWKYTLNAYDFNVLANSPITLPIEWHNSKIPGYAIRASVPTVHGFSAFVVMSSVAARFFPPTVAGIAPPAPPGVFRIDHDEKFNQTTHLQYQPYKRGPWFGFNWRYDSGLVSGAVPCIAPTATCSFDTSVADGGSNTTISKGQVALLNDATGVQLSADQEFEAGLTCNGKPVVSGPLAAPATVCNGVLASPYLQIPAPGTENDDHNPQRIAPRSLFDLDIGEDNLFNTEHYRWSLGFTAINVTNKEALYNFMSTFSGTHYVTPRTLTVALGFHF